MSKYEQRCKRCGTLIAEGPEKCRVCPACGYQGLVSVGGWTGRGSVECGVRRVVECPICGGKNESARTFQCPECGRDGLCLDHRDGRTGCCEECAESHTEGSQYLNLTGSKAGERMTVRVGSQHVASRWCPATRLHGKVQLWAGGPYWAKTNIGADKPEDYGLYFWWGDTIGYRREGNTWIASDGSSRNFSFNKGNAQTYGKANATLKRRGWTTSAGILAGILVPAYDAAHVHWGGGWRMPTILELGDLVSMCDWTWTTINGVKGYVVQGRGSYADASIFLPCAGHGNGTSLGYAGIDGYYWSSVPDSESNYSLLLYCHSNYHGTSKDCRDYGRSIRPVQGAAE